MHECLVHRRVSPGTSFPVFRASSSWVLGANPRLFTGAIAPGGTAMLGMI